MISGAALLRNLRKALAAVADAKRALKMQAYMKSKMPFHGVPAPALKAIARLHFKGLMFTDFGQLDAAVRALWHGARFREERYAAIRLLDRRELQPAGEALALLEELISTGAWWDLVDDVANHFLHPLLVSDPAITKRTLRRWSRSGDLWLRRAAIVAQVNQREAIDSPFLFEMIEPAIDEKAFFLRKAIGWSLRSLAKVRPEQVRAWLDKYGDRASGLTTREAMKGLATHDDGSA